jgi:hypothetical protein
MVGTRRRAVGSLTTRRRSARSSIKGSLLTGANDPRWPPPSDDLLHRWNRGRAATIGMTFSIVGIYGGDMYLTQYSLYFNQKMDTRYGYEAEPCDDTEGPHRTDGRTTAAQASPVPRGQAPAQTHSLTANGPRM